MGATPTMNRSAKDGARSSPHYGGEGVTHSPIVPRCLLTARYGRFMRDPRRPVCVPASNRVSDPISGYASRKVSILQTWTYSPQKRQDGSAFALTYRLRLRSCKLMGAFIISPLPPILLEPLQNSRAPSLPGHYSASSLLRTHPSPSRRSPTSRFRRL